MGNEHLYFIAIDNTNNPLLLGSEDILLIYDDKIKAETAAQKLTEKYLFTSLKATPIEDKTVFFSKMAACDITKYLLNGDGKILKASDFGCTELLKIDGVESDLYDEIEEAQPTVKKTSSAYSNSSSGCLGKIIVFVVIWVLLISVLTISDEISSRKKKPNSSEQSDILSNISKEWAEKMM